MIFSSRISESVVIELGTLCEKYRSDLKTSIRERVIFSGTLSGKPIVLQGNYLIPNILFDKLIFNEIFPLENHGMEDKKVFQLCKEGVKVKEMCLI